MFLASFVVIAQKSPVIDRIFFNGIKEYTTIDICIDYIQVEEYTVVIGLKRLLFMLIKIQGG